MGCTTSSPRAKDDQVADEVAQAKPSNKQLLSQPVHLDFTTSLDSVGYSSEEKTGARNSSESYKIRAEGATNTIVILQYPSCFIAFLIQSVDRMNLALFFIWPAVLTSCKYDTAVTNCKGVEESILQGSAKGK